jgi:tetratricopeptide (TPR) repeat protein
MDQIVHLNTRGPLRRALTFLPLALALAGAWFSVRWYVGNTIADNLNPDDRALETARMSSALAPSDPLTHWALAEIERAKLPLDQVNQSVKEYDEAASLSPNDYRFWLSLGRALEQSGDSQKAEKAMNRAVELAPTYSAPHWYLGNLLLRNGKDSDAFSHLRRASEADPQLRIQVFNLIWEVFGKNPAELDKAIGATPAARAEFATYLVNRQQYDEGLRLWGVLTAQEKREQRATGAVLTKTLLDAKRFRQALEMWNEVTPGERLKGSVGQFFDGGFELTDSTSAGPFAWQVQSVPQAQAGLDPTRMHGGTHSLRLLFKSPAKAVVSVSQIIVVEPNTQYDLGYFLKTSKLESAGTPLIEILDAADGAILGTSAAAPAGDNDWQQISIPFKTGAKSEAILIRISRASCGENSICPIFGTLWYDDFDLKRRG